MKKIMKSLIIAVLMLFVLTSCENGLLVSGTNVSNNNKDESISRAISTTDDDWIQSSSIYQVYVKAFNDTDGNGIGDLQGVMDKIPYLKSLGIKTIWLMPVFEADSYHGYNTNNYYQVRGDYGDNQKLKDLVTEAHNNDMKLILDLVINHTGYNVSYFNDYSKTDWYCWQNSSLNYNNDSTWSDIQNWETPWGGGSVSQWDVKLSRGNYYAVFGQDMPDLNFRNPEVVEEVKNIMKFWVETADVDGFRCDAARYLVEEGNGAQKDLYATHSLWKEFRAALQSVKPSAILLAEAPTETTEQMLAYLGDGDEFNTAFHFGLQYKLVGAFRDGYRQGGMLDELYAVQNNMPEGTQDTIFLSNHDEFAGQRIGYQMNMNIGKMKGAASLYILLSGIPAVYYAEELGYNNVNGEAGGDYPLRGDIDWDDVATQENDSNSMLNHYKGLFVIRNAYDALASGISQFISSYDGSWDSQSQDSDTMAIIREYYGEKILVIHNFSQNSKNMYVNLESANNLNFANGEVTYQLMGESAGNQLTSVTDSNRSFYPVGTIPGLTSVVIFFGSIESYRNDDGTFPIYPHDSEHWSSLYLRGTNNSWDSSLMTRTGNVWSIQATFESGGRFKFDRNADWSINYGTGSTADIAVQSGDDIYIPSAGTWTITLNEKSLYYTMNNDPIDTYSVSGLITEDGAGLSDVTLSIGLSSVTTDSDGNYTLSGLANGSYIVTPSKSSYTFSPSSRDIIISDSDISVDEFIANQIVTTDLIMHFSEWESATTYYVHPWDGLSGDISMEYEGLIDGSHWWITTISNPPDHFMFCFNNSNNNWDGGNRSYDNQGSDIYIKANDNTIYTTR